MREALKNAICPACSGCPAVGEEERNLNIENLRMENSRLKEQRERLADFVSSMTGKPLSLLLSLSPDSVGYLADSPADHLLSQGKGSSFHDSSALINSRNQMSLFELNGIHVMEKQMIIETASGAFEELVELLRVDEPIWEKSHSDGKYVLHRDRYVKLFPKTSHFKNSSARTESSKDSGVVQIHALDLVKIILDSDKRPDLFPSIITRARTLETLDTGSFGGTLHLMYEQIHILSPFVAPREFFFLRYCRQVDSGTWVIVDTSIDCFREIQDIHPGCSWKFPSGTMIQSLPDGKSKVTWVEHVEVNDKTQNHKLYRDLVCGSRAYGATRWVCTLQRMCERFSYVVMSKTAPTHKLEGVINVPEGRAKVMKLSHRMVKSLCVVLNMSERRDLPHLSEVTHSGVRVSIRKSTEAGQPCGMIVVAATSLRLPVSYENLFDFLRDENRRTQWDLFSVAGTVTEIAHISTGVNPGNCISLIQPPLVDQNNMLILQENSIDELGALVIYAPIDIPAIMATINGDDTTKIPILPSGFLISSDSFNDKSTTSASTSTTEIRRQSCSLVTLAFQLLVNSNATSRHVVMESVTAANTLITSTIQKIKAAFDCSDFD